jgi:hypothetical protein
MSEKLPDPYSSSKITEIIKSRRVRGTGHVACKTWKLILYRILAGKPEGKRPLGRQTRRWEHNSRLDIKEVGK